MTYTLINDLAHEWPYLVLADGQPIARFAEWGDAIAFVDSMNDGL